MTAPLPRADAPPAPRGPSLAEATRAADALKAQGRWDAAVAAHRQITQAFPREPVAFHNLAATLGDVGQAAAAEEAVVHAMRLGLDAPESWLVRARAVQMLGRLDEAEQLYRQALRRRPLYLDAMRDLAQLRWMRSGDVAAATAPIDAALAQAPAAPALLQLKAQMLVETQQEQAALPLLRAAAAAHPGDPSLALSLAQVALNTGAVAESLAAAQRAAALAPAHAPTHVACIDALLAAGELARAEQLAAALHAQIPTDQPTLARLATAWRLLGDARYAKLYDYDTLVGVETLDTPPGWPDLGSYLAELASALHGAHRYRTHPFQQSIKQGAQLPDVLRLPHPAAQALAVAIDGPIRRHLARLGTGRDPLRARQRGGYAVSGGWSIRMQAGGRHVNHVHSEGWISSACYIETPTVLEGQQGHLKLGEPGIALDPLPPAERFVAPQAGRLVLFPSYMWHGTVPFATAGVRMSAAFDLVPAEGPPGS
jgi:tetratricopeptide (TPR) repeat protein